MRTIAILVGFLLVANSSRAAFTETTELISGCRTWLRVTTPGSDKLAPVEGLESAACLGYLAGHLAGYQRADQLRHVCLPDPVTQGQLVRMFVQWADRNAEQWHLPPSQAVEAAIREAFPCAGLGCGRPGRCSLLASSPGRHK